MLKAKLNVACAANVTCQAAGSTVSTTGRFGTSLGKTKKPPSASGSGSFFCLNRECARKIFAERFGPWASPYARRSKRLNHFLLTLAVSTGGEGSSRLGKAMGYSWSSDTFLRMIKTAKMPVYPVPEVIGIDDFAFRKGHRYGTIIVDLQRRHVIDLLPDRRQDTLQAWLENHPKLRVISRDRAGPYAKAATQGAPQACQVADRWHLMKNLGEALTRFLNHKTKLIRQAHEQTLVQEVSPVEDPMSVLETKEKSPQGLSVADRNRQSRCKRVWALRERGMGIRAIARKLGLSRKTVRKYLYHDQPHLFKKGQRRSELDAFLPYLRERWHNGLRNAAQLWRELKQQGYQGCPGSVRHYLAPWREKDPAAPQTPLQDLPKYRCPNPGRAAYLMTRPMAETTPRDLAFLNHLYALCPQAERAAKLGRQFLALLRERRKDLFGQWLKQVDISGIKELKGFAFGLRRDRHAVEQAMFSEWSNGQTEGQVNRLKLIKRHMFGRASFALLKRRLLLIQD